MRMMMKIMILSGVFLLFVIQILVMPFLGSDEVNGISTFSSNMIIVDQSGSGDYTTISNAINNSNPNDTIYIKNGDYTGNHTIHHPLSVIGESKEFVKIRPLKEGNLYLFKLNSTHISFSNLTIIGDKNNGISQVCFYSDLNVNVSNLKIDNVNIFNISSAIMLYSACINLTLNCIEMNNSGIFMGFPYGDNAYRQNVTINNSTFRNSPITFPVNNFFYMSECNFINCSTATFSIGKGDESGNYICNNNNFFNVDHAGFQSHLIGDFTENIIIDSTFTTFLSRGRIENNFYDNVTEPFFFYYPDGLNVENNSIYNSGRAFHIWDSYQDGIVLKNNTIRNCEQGIILTRNQKSTFKNNILENCGFEINIRRLDLTDLEISNTNIVNGKPVLFEKDTSSFEIDNDFGQLILHNCQEFSIDNLNLSGSNNYPLIFCYESSNGEIINSMFEGQSEISLHSSNLIDIHNNDISNSSSIIIDETSSGCRIANNTFHCSNQSLFDEGNNQWDKDGNGNYWTSLNISDSNDDGIGDTVVNIPGGTNVDRYPLAPGVRLEWDMLTDRATTGEDIPIEITAENFNIEILENLSFSFGNLTSGFMRRDLDHTKTLQTVFLSVPENSVDPIEIMINTSDSLGKNSSIGPISISVYDNDPPELSLLSSTSTTQAGDNISITISANDNIGIDQVWAVIDGPETSRKPLSPLFGLWNLEFETEETYIGAISITIFANDSAGNTVDFQINDILIIDGNPPNILEDFTPIMVNTGETLTFSMLCDDTNGISWMNTDYKIEGALHSINMSKLGFNSHNSIHFPEDFDPMDYSGNWSYFLGNVSIPVDNDEVVEYRFSISDTSSNIINGPWKSVDILDSISPVIEIKFNSTEYNTGDIIDINFSISDNIGIGEKWMNVYQNDKIIFNISDDGMVHYEIPSNLTGSIFIQAFAKDFTGNHISAKTDNIFISDNIAPTIGSIQDLQIKVGETMTITIEANDNIEITLIEWSVDTKAGSGPNINLTLGQPGYFILNITVMDAEGNVAYQDVNIEVIKEEKPNNEKVNALLFLIPGLLIIVIFITILLLIRRSKRNNQRHIEE